MQKKKIKRPPSITRSATEKQFLTKGNLIPIIEDLKDFIKATAKGTEHKLSHRIDLVDHKLSHRIDLVKVAITEHSKEIRELKTDVREFKTDMVEVKSQLSTISTKLDGQNAHLGDHEGRITTLETTHH